MHDIDAIDEDEDGTLQYLNTGAYDDGGLMAQQYEYSGFERDELVPEFPEDERIIGSLPVAKKHMKRLALLGKPLPVALVIFLLVARAGTLLL